MSAERKLGGWYRLWLLVAALYALAVVIVALSLHDIAREPADELALSNLSVNLALSR